MIQLKFKKLNENAVIPSYAKPGDAGLDLTAISYHMEHKGGHWTEYKYVEYGTGLAVEIPEGHVGLIFPRSSISKTVLSMANAVGVIDSGYRGEILCRFKYEDARSGNFFLVGERIAQLIVIPYPTMEPIEVDELSETERGVTGFGSSGK